MSKIPPSPKTSIPRQTDIVIDPDGTLHFSFLWDDLSDCIQALTGNRGYENFSLEASFNDSKRNSDFGLYQNDRISLEFPKRDYQSCRLCPKNCGFNRSRGVHPRCGDSSLRVSNYGLTMGDEAEIRGLRGSGAIMLGGCSLSCPSCHNPEMVASGEKISIGQLIELCYHLRDQGAHNIQFLSPTVHFPALRVALTELRKAHFELPIIFKSSGYESLVEIDACAGLVDVWLPDLKYGPDSTWARRAGVPNYFSIASKAILAMVQQVGPLRLGLDGTAQSGVLVRHVMAPLAPEERQTINNFLHSLPTGVAVSRSMDFVDFHRT